MGRAIPANAPDNAPLHKTICPCANLRPPSPSCTLLALAPTCTFFGERMIEVTEVSIAELRDALETGRTTAVELVKAYLARKIGRAHV